jgi:hypothetical protein
MDRNLAIPYMINQLGDTLSGVIRERVEKSDQQAVMDYFKDNELTPENIQQFQSLNPRVPLTTVYKLAPAASSAKEARDVDNIGKSFVQNMSNMKTPAQVNEWIMNFPASMSAKAKAGQMIQQMIEVNKNMFKKDTEKLGQNETLVDINDVDPATNKPRIIAEGLRTEKKEEPIDIYKIESDGRPIKSKAHPGEEFENAIKSGWTKGVPGEVPKKETVDTTPHQVQIGDEVHSMVYRPNDPSADKNGYVTLGTGKKYKEGTDAIGLLIKRDELKEKADAIKAKRDRVEKRDVEVRQLKARWENSIINNKPMSKQAWNDSMRDIIDRYPDVTDTSPATGKWGDEPPETIKKRTLVSDGKGGWVYK